MGRASDSPRVIGIDDWAWRKGQRYGTIICDLERRQVIDLLPTRNGALPLRCSEIGYGHSTDHHRIFDTNRSSC